MFRVQWVGTGQVLLESEKSRPGRVWSPVACPSPASGLLCPDGRVPEGQ